MPDVSKLVAILIARRIKLGLSQRRLGFLSGLGTSICQYEAGVHEPTLSSLMTWANSVGCDVTVTPRPKGKRS